MNATGDTNQPPPDHTAPLTWAVLLGRWIEFAKSAVALPDDDPGRRMRRCVVDVITLQAVWFALREIESLPADEWALGLDRAQVLIDKHAAMIEETWAGAAMPAALRELIGDARAELAKHVK
ncbi:MAG: hypothetical protein K8S99_04935 [Planctomycetes bacterium]|nr:hypothetical protein [Planctomycetota bacterium]